MKIVATAFICCFLCFFVLAFEPNPLLDSLGDNEALNLGPYACVPPAGTEHCRGITDYSGFVYDAERHQMLMFGGGHATTFRDDVDVFNFDTLNWSSAYAPTPCAETADLSNRNLINGSWFSTGHPVSRHTYDLTVFDPQTGGLILLASIKGAGFCTSGIDDDFYFPGKVAHYDPDALIWHFTDVSAATWTDFSSSAYDPISGKIIVVGQGGMWTYDPVTETAEQQLSEFPHAIKQALSYSKNMVYFPPTDRMYYLLNNGRVFEVTLNRNEFSQSAVAEMTGLAGDLPTAGETGWAYDSVNQVIGGGVWNDAFHVFDPVEGLWTRSVINVNSNGPIGPVGDLAYHAIEYDPVNNVFIFVSSQETGRRVWAYRLKRRRIIEQATWVPATESAALSIRGGVGHPFDVQTNDGVSVVWSNWTSSVMTAGLHHLTVPLPTEKRTLFLRVREEGH